MPNADCNGNIRIHSILTLACCSMLCLMLSGCIWGGYGLNFPSKIDAVPQYEAAKAGGTLLSITQLSGNEVGAGYLCVSGDASIAIGFTESYPWFAHRSSLRREFTGEPDWEPLPEFYSHDSDVRCFNAITGLQIDKLTGHSGQLRFLALSSNGAVAASISTDGTARIWDIGLRKMISQIKVNHPYWPNLSLSADGKIAVIPFGFPKNEMEGIVWDVRAGKELFRAKTDKVLALSPDGKWLATNPINMKMQLWSIPDGQMRSEWEGYQDIIFHPNGRELLVEKERILPVLSTDNLRQIRVIDCPGRYRTISPDGKWLLSLGEREEWVLRDYSTGEVAWKVQVNVTTYRRSSHLSDGGLKPTWLTDSSGFFILDQSHWRIGLIKIPKEIPRREREIVEIRRIPYDRLKMSPWVALSNDGKILGRDGGEWKPNTYDVIDKWTIPPQRNQNVDVSPDGNKVVISSEYGGGGGCLYTIDGKRIDMGKESHVSITGDRNVAVWWNGDQARLITADWVKKVPFAAWDVRTRKKIWENKQLWDYHLWISGDKQTLLTRDIQERWCVCNPETGVIVRRFDWKNAECRAVSFDGKIAAFYSFGQGILLRDLTTGKLLHKLPPFGQSPIVAITRDNRRLLIAPGVLTKNEKGEVHIFDISSGTEIGCFHRHNFGIDGLAISPNGQWVASADMKEVCVWQMPQTGDQSAPIETVRLDAKLGK